MKKFRCKVCGEIIETEGTPEQCPRCKVKGDDKFEEVKEGNKLMTHLTLIINIMTLST